MATFQRRPSQAPPRGARQAEEVLLQTVSVAALVDSHSVAAVARRAAHTLGLDSADKTRVAIAAGELATNIARHAKRGTIRIYSGPRYLKIVAQDSGPGIADIETALRDGHSDGRKLGVNDTRREGLGCGLGAVRRLMDYLDIRSTPGLGTCVVAIKHVARSRNA